MPKSAKRKWYAVRKGWDGPKIYDTWEETKKSVSRYRGAEFKGFLSRAQAEEWLGSTQEPAMETDDMPLQCPPERASGGAPNLLTGDGSKSTPMEISDCECDSVSESDSRSTITGSASSDVQPEAPESSTASAQPDQPIQEAMELSPEQQQVLNMVKNGKSVFFTGSAGTGKSVLLREIIRWCEEELIAHAVTASTGIAAVNVGGSTLHSWAGIGLGKEKAEKLVGKILGQAKWARQKEKMQREARGLSPLPDDYDSDDNPNMRVLSRWRKCRVLIIDEISMVDGKLFDKLEFIARALRKSSLPFGGIQLVLSGDFCQLPPVPDSENGVQIPATFAFDALSWDKCVGRPICLKKVFRQKDQTFVDMLNAMRFGNLDAEIIKRFRKLDRPVTYDDGLIATELFPTRREVETANSNRLNSIKSEKFTYKALDTPGWDAEGKRISQEHMNRLLDRLVAPKEIALKVGAQVMLIKNMVQGMLVNGSLGRVTDFCTTREAIARGIKIGLPDMDNGGRPWKGELKAMGTRSSEDEKRTRAMVERIPPGKYPVVEFSTAAVGKVVMLCVPNTFEVNNAEGEVEARRDQIALILAWALSIHKSQGQTLERVKVSLARTFEKGQAYVALSRATKMETLEVRGFDPLKVMAHPRVIEWTRANTDIPLPPALSAEEVEEEDKYWSNV